MLSSVNSKFVLNTAALADAEAALTIQPDHVRALMRKGIALYGLGKLEEAKTALDKANQSARKSTISLAMFVIFSRHSFTSMIMTTNRDISANPHCSIVMEMCMCM